MKKYDYLTGYKATNSEMKCHGFQYKLGEWYKHDGEIKLCEKGFHFCKYPSGPWSYYSESGTRIFKVEAKNVIEEYSPGADLKFVCSEIRLVEEIKSDGDGNTGHMNTGHMNTGYGNTGY
ncbi:MAG: pentapeptide repeat-containing protein, partial [Smithella sp.]